MSKKSRGFTLVELLLAMAFMGGLVLFGTLTIVQSLSIYNKGLAMKQIDQVGRTLIDDINRLSGGASAVNLQVNSNGSAGYMCLSPAGSNDIRAYIWSEVKDEGANGAYPAGVYTYMSPSSPEKVTLARTNEGVASNPYCSLPSSANTNVPTANITKLLNDQVRILSTDVADDPSNPSLKRITFWIGTYGATAGTTPVQDGAGGWKCQTGTLGNFCAFGKFQTIIYTPNE